MSINHRVKFGVAVEAVAAGYHPFEVQVWAFAGQSVNNPDEWIVNLQGFVRLMSGQTEAVPTPGYINEYETVCIFTTDNQAVDTTVNQVFTLDVQYPPNNLPHKFQLYTLNANATRADTDKLKFTVGSATNAVSPMSVKLVDTEIEAKFKLLGSTEVVVVDPIF